MRNILNDIVDRTNLKQIIVAGLILRVAASIFSFGYGMHDDHFYTVEIAQSWIDHANADGWLNDPSRSYTQAKGHSLFYPGVLFYVLKIFNRIGISTPEEKMFFMRLLHGFYSLLIILFGYLITFKLSNDKRVAKMLALFLSLLWFMPMLSVRNLVEITCIPPLMIGSYLLIRNGTRDKLYIYILAGFIMAFSISIRYQVSLMVAATGFVLLIQSGWKRAGLFTLGVLLNIAIFQGLVDYFNWGYPFAEFIGYFNYNVKNSGAYPSGPIYNFILLISGMFLIPFGFFIWPGFFNKVGKNLIIWLPSLVFLIFHSYFPNKQERFILPMIPYLLICGIIGWDDFLNKSRFWAKRVRLYNRLLYVFFTLNGIILIFLTFSSTKKNRLEAMIFLRKKGDVTSYIVENSNQNDMIELPRFYLGAWCNYYNITKNEPLQNLRERIKDSTWLRPNYVIFFDDKNMGDRVLNFEKKFAGLQYEAFIKPSPLDQFMHWINPVNDNQNTYIFSIRYPDQVKLRSQIPVYTGNADAYRERFLESSLR